MFIVEFDPTLNKDYLILSYLRTYWVLDICPLGSITGCMFGASLVIQIQISGHGKVYGQWTDGRSNGRVDGRTDGRKDAGNGNTP